jgi:hypothetical protein
MSLADSNHVDPCHSGRTDSHIRSRFFVNHSISTAFPTFPDRRDGIIGISSNQTFNIEWDMTITRSVDRYQSVMTALVDGDLG